MTRQSTRAMDNDTLAISRIEKHASFYVAGMSQHFLYTGASTIPLFWESFAPHIGDVPDQIRGVTYGVSFNQGRDGFDYMAAVEVRSIENVGSTFRALRIPEHRYAIFQHRGHVSGIHDTMKRILLTWFRASDYAQDETPTFERYGSEFDAATGSGLVEIFIPIRTDS